MSGPAAPDASVVLLDGPWRHRLVRANGLALHVAEAGPDAGPLVLLVHGFPQFWWTWRRQLVALAEAGFHAVAVDLRGFGASDKPPRGYDALTLSDDLAGLIAALGESSAVLVGHDVGGDLTWATAARHSGVVRAAVVVGSAHPLQWRAALRADGGQRRAAGPLLAGFQVPRRPERLLTRDDAWLRTLLQRWSGPAWRGGPEFEPALARYAEAMRIRPVAFCAAEQYRWLWRSVLRADGRTYVTALQRRISAPVLQLHGALDPYVLPETLTGAQRWIEAPYDCRLLPGVGHLVPDEDPDTVTAELLRWAGQHS